MNILKDLKAQYKTATGQEYVAVLNNTGGSQQQQQPKKKEAKKEMAPAAATATTAVPPEAEGVVKNIVEQGNKIRDLKTNKASKVRLEFWRDSEYQDIRRPSQ